MIGIMIDERKYVGRNSLEVVGKLIEEFYQWGSPNQDPPKIDPNADQWSTEENNLIQKEIIRLAASLGAMIGKDLEVNLTGNNHKDADLILSMIDKFGVGQYLQMIELNPISVDMLEDCKVEPIQYAIREWKQSKDDTIIVTQEVAEMIYYEIERVRSDFEILPGKKNMGSVVERASLRAKTYMALTKVLESIDQSNRLAMQSTSR